MDNLVKRITKLLDNGVYDPDVLFQIVYPGSGRHYATIRKAIHMAKTR